MNEPKSSIKLWGKVSSFVSTRLRKSSGRRSNSLKKEAPLDYSEEGKVEAGSTSTVSFEATTATAARSGVIEDVSSGPVTLKTETDSSEQPTTLGLKEPSPSFMYKRSPFIGQSDFDVASQCELAGGHFLDNEERGDSASSVKRTKEKVLKEARNILQEQKDMLANWELRHAKGETDPIDTFIDDLSLAEEQLERHIAQLRPQFHELCKTTESVAVYERQLRTLQQQQKNGSILLECLNEIFETVSISRETMRALKRLKVMVVDGEEDAEARHSDEVAGNSLSGSSVDIDSSMIVACNEILGKLDAIRALNMGEFRATQDCLAEMESYLDQFHALVRRTTAAQPQATFTDGDKYPNLFLLKEMLQQAAC